MYARVPSICFEHNFLHQLAMLELTELSRVGFGGYRISYHVREHRDALVHAIKSGCNLIDTAVSYTNGDSERLIGDVVRGLAHRVFIVTKAGYVQRESLPLLGKRGASEGIRDELVRTSSDSLHSINPDFLETQIQTSCTRLQRSQLDAFLLHNPEYYFDQIGRANSLDEYYGRIKKAFMFLEDQVVKGRIRYYGISSNTLDCATNSQKTTSLPKLLTLAKEVSSNHHFKLIEFPFNLLEPGGSQDLTKTAREHGLTTLSNRPLNAKSSFGLVRFATYEGELTDLDEQRDRKFLDEFLELLSQRLKEIGARDNIMDFVPIQVITASWASFRNPDLIDHVFDLKLVPFLGALYDEHIDHNVLAAFSKLKRIVELYAKRYLSRQAENLRRELVQSGKLNQNDERPFALVACQHYLDAGIDHVLVGMRRTQYVESLKSLFCASDVGDF